MTVLNSYPAYKPSGVEWLGDVPANWETQRLRNVAEMRVSNVDKHVKEDEIFVRLCNYVDVYKNDYINGQMDFMRATATDEEVERFRLEKDDVLITKDSETWDDIGVPALVTEPAADLISGYHLALLRPRPDKLAGAYLLRALQSKGLAYQFHVEAKGVTRYGLSHAGIKSVWFPLPPLPEQTAIARFLDHADRRIRRYIRAKQKLITLLEEQKQAIINQAVTGQIDVRTGQPYPAYKPSGVEWLGDVPAHWEVRRLKFLANIPSGQVNPHIEEHRNKVLIAPNHITSGSGEITGLETAEAQGADSGKYEIRVGDVVYSKIRPNLRKAAISPVDGLCSADMYPIRVRKNEINPSFFLHLLLSNRVTRYAVDCSMRVAMPKINREALGGCWLVYPTLPDQMAIITWISSETAGLAVAIKRAQRGIDLLREYRIRLIADVATGKLDVRETAAALPEVDPLSTEDYLDDSLDTAPSRTSTNSTPHSKRLKHDHRHLRTRP